MTYNKLIFNTDVLIYLLRRKPFVKQEDETKRKKLLSGKKESFKYFRNLKK